MKTVDARGQSCPIPVIKTKLEIDKKEAIFALLIDDDVAKENVTRLATNLGYKVEIAENNDEYTLTMTREEQ